MFPSFINKHRFWKIFLPAVAVAVNAAFISSLLWGSNSIYTWKALKEKKSEMEIELADLNSERAQLSREIRLLKKDPAYVEKVIRQRLNYVKQNEILYIFEDGGAHSIWDNSVKQIGTDHR